MHLTEHYNELFQNSIRRINEDNYEIDQLIDSSEDNRFGISLILRPSSKVNSNIQKFIDHLKEIEPNQYFYPDSDIHVTVMSIISCYEGFNLGKIDLRKYIELIEESISGIPGFNIKFEGITASPSCLMVQGFHVGDSLNQIRDQLRINFKNSSLEQSIDKRYSIQTAHSSIVRFKEKLQNKDEFLNFIQRNHSLDFGSSRIGTLELVFNDWYQRKERGKILHKFSI